MLSGGELISSAQITTTAPSQAGISRMVLAEKISPAFGNTYFGNAGPYELLIYHVSSSLDPSAIANRDIFGLEKAPRSRSGFVEYSFDVSILKPIDMAKSNGKIVYNVINRGNGFIDLNGADAAPTQFYLNQGYIFVESAWQGELKIGGRGLAAHFPIASDKGHPIVKKICQETTPALLHAQYGVSTTGPLNLELTYPVASVTTASASVYVRENETDAWRKLPADHLRILDRNHVRLIQAQGFDAGAIYDVVYSASDPIVSGIGFASVRDLISFLRSQKQDREGEPNPLLSTDGRLQISRTFAMGISQSGRFLRVFIWQGFNQDVNGLQVFDGVMPIIAGARKGDFNRLFAMPSTVSTEHEWRRVPDNSFPFAYPVTHDPLTGKDDGILGWCARTHTCPKIVHLDSDNEMGAAFSWMLVTDADRRPIEQPDNVRLYLAAGLQHMFTIVAEGCRGKPVTYSWMPFQHALFVAMDEWVSEGIAPPLSRYPSLEYGGLVSLETAKAEWPAIPGYPFSTVRNVPEDWDYSELPPVSRGAYPILTPPLNRDGNPIYGIVHPEITVPIGTVQGHSLRIQGNASGEQCLLQGEFIPFALTREQRDRDHDPRLSIEERYPGGQGEYAAKLREAAQRLVENHLLLPQEVESVISAHLPTKAANTQ
jgi:hypothetical protein